MSFYSHRYTFCALLNKPHVTSIEYKRKISIKIYVECIVDNSLQAILGAMVYELGCIIVNMEKIKAAYSFLQLLKHILYDIFKQAVGAGVLQTFNTCASATN